MKKIVISNDDGGLLAEVLPDYGGMLTRLNYHGKDVIFFDEDMLHKSNVLAGGCPVLFPFPSRTKNDTYTLNGKAYTMPFHGLVKCSSFGVVETKKNSTTLYITNNEASQSENYPFDFRLEVTYTLKNDTVEFLAAIANRSSEPMPHYFGWHHYFTASDKAEFQLDTDMGRYVNYLDGKEYENNIPLDLTREGDYVFYEKTGNKTEIINKADGYHATIETDNSYESLVVCTLFDGRVTAEPWLGLPDSISTGKYVKWIKPGSRETYSLRIELSDLL